jgi:sugar lactone lactonase YvrE
MMRAATLLALLLLLACSGDLEVVTTCEDEPGLHPVCGFQNPEDFAVPDDGELIVSQMGSMVDTSRRGSLAVFDLASEQIRVVYPGDRSTPIAATPGWGDPDCPGEPLSELNPHGLHLARLADGRRRLLVVNHGGRESIEFFEVTGEGEQLAVQWRGCAVPPGLFFNDVVNLPDGGLLATHMMSGWPLWGFLRAGLGFDTGAVYAWQADGGWRELPGTAAPFPNGIEISADGRDLYLNVYGTGEVRRISRESGERLATAQIPSPDNLSWARDGRLLVASHVGSVSDGLRCQELEAGACPMAFEILALDAETLAAERIFANEGPPMGAGTVAVDLGDELVIGTFAGDRILRVRR